MGRGVILYPFLKDTMSANTYLPISPQAPPSLTITNITNAVYSVITVLETNSYVAGQVIHLTVPQSYGMQQADQLNGEILSINGQDFTTTIDTFNFAPFVTPTGNTQQPASLSPAGSRNLYNYTFVPFHSVGNVGN